MGYNRDRIMLSNALVGAVSMVAGAQELLPGAEFTFRLMGSHRAKVEPTVIDASNMLPADPGRALCVATQQTPYKDPTIPVILAGIGLDCDPVKPVDIYLRPGPDETTLVMALSVSGRLWMDDVATGSGWDKLGATHSFVGYSADLAKKRLDAAGIPAGQVEITETHDGCALTAIGPQGVRWIRLCRHFGERMTEPYEGMTVEKDGAP